MKPGAGISGTPAAGGELVWKVVALAIVVALFAGGRHTPAVAGLIALPWDKLMHATTFGVLALSLVRGFSLPLVWAGVAAALFGVADELHQTTLPGRDPSVGDWGADVVGVALVLAWLRWRHRTGCTNQS